MVDRSLNYGRPVIRRFLRSIGRYETVLDIGAGHGDDLLCAREVNPDARCYALESFAPNVTELRSKGIEVFEADIERDRFPFEAGALEVVMANQILEHTKELFWIFDQISRILKVGGHLIIGVPNLAALHNRILLALGRQPSPLKNNSAHVRGFTRRDLIQFVDSGFPSGYRLVAFGGGNFYPFPAPLARPLARLFPTFAWGIFLLLRKTGSYDGQFLDFPVRNQLETNFFLGR